MWCTLPANLVVINKGLHYKQSNQSMALNWSDYFCLLPRNFSLKKSTIRNYVFLYNKINDLILKKNYVCMSMYYTWYMYTRCTTVDSSFTRFTVVRAGMPGSFKFTATFHTTTVRHAFSLYIFGCCMLLVHKFNKIVVFLFSVRFPFFPLSLLLLGHK